MKCQIQLDHNEQTSPACRRAAQTAFGPGIARFFRDNANDFGRRIWNVEPITVHCNSAQLVAYMVARDKLGGSNMWKSLKVEILEPKCCDRRFFDATR